MDETKPINIKHVKPKKIIEMKFFELIKIENDFSKSIFLLNQKFFFSGKYMRPLLIIDNSIIKDLHSFFFCLH